MCNACSYFCCASDEFEHCGCEECPNPECQAPYCSQCGENPTMPGDDLGLCAECGDAWDPDEDATDPPEFHYIAVEMGSHGGHAHVAPDCPPETLAALGQMLDRAYEQAASGDDDVERMPI